MIIEDISKDGVVLKNENSRFFKKRIETGLFFHNGRSYIKFNRDTNEYEIWLSKNQPDDLWESYDLIHEVHHLQKELMFPKWMAGEVFQIDKTYLPTLDLNKIINGILDDYAVRFSYLNEHLKAKLMKALIQAHSSFFKHVESYGVPQHTGFLNAFEDIGIENHINFAHSEISKRTDNYALITLNNLMESLNDLSDIIKQITGGFSLLFAIPFTSKKELESFYEYYDLAIYFSSAKLTPESYYQTYYHGLRRLIKKIPRKAFADRYRTKLELKRIKSTLKELKK